MNLWTMIVAVVAIASVTEILRNYFKNKSEGTGKAELEKLNQRIEVLEKELRERIETLERIVTDEKSDLKRQFDYLDKAS